jgi:hypothetical protein
MYREPFPDANTPAKNSFREYMKQKPERYLDKTDQTGRFQHNRVLNNSDKFCQYQAQINSHRKKSKHT